MRVSIAVLAAVLLIAPPIPVGGQAQPSGVRISEIMSDPDTTAGQREFIEVWNTGQSAVALAGWKLHDAATASGSVNTFTFPPWSLPPNGRVVVWGGGVGDGRGPAWSNSAVWNNAGDGVSLVDSGGATIDWVGYGSAVPPPGFGNQSVPAAPPRGQSLQLDGSAWAPGAPTPGSAPGAVGGSLTIEVANVAPSVAFAATPVSARPGSSIAVSFVVDDPNGPSDVVTWRLSSGQGILATGTATGTRTLHLAAPPSPGAWVLNLTATDAAGASAAAAAIIQVRNTDLVVTIPAGALQFGQAAPGESEVTGVGAVDVTNDGDADVTPLLDVSGFAGSGGLAFPAEGHVRVTWDAGNQTIAYVHPLTALSPLAPHGHATLRFHLVDVPAGLAAGTYGASFTLVAQ
ncbi:MAG: lamin tail domain-containing protein [bacterium]